MSLMEQICDMYDPDTVFKHFRVVEFPTSFVGLSTSQELDLKVDFNNAAYLKTVCDGRLMNFEEARGISASHRAFIVTPINSHRINIDFKPINECVSRAVRQKKHMGNRFVFDLRLIKTNGTFCCNDESHAEIGRYYVSGQYEYCKLIHYPNVVSFEELGLNEIVKRYVRIINQSKLMTVRMYSVKATGFSVTPHSFTISPNSSKRLTIMCKPPALMTTKKLLFHIRNPHDDVTEGLPFDPPPDNNFLIYSIDIEAHVICKKKPKEVEIESLHTIYEPHNYYTFLGEEIEINKKRKDDALLYLHNAKTNIIRPNIIEKLSCKKQRCYSYESIKDPRKQGVNFCKIIIPKISSEELLSLFFEPTTVNFGRVALHTYGEHELVIKNKSKYVVTLKFEYDRYVVYTDDRLIRIKLNLAPLSTSVVNIGCYGTREGNFTGTFQYIIDNKYERRHPYTLYVGNPKLTISESTLKFGMVTSEAFVTSVPVKLINHFNVDIDFKWGELNPDIPFEIIPNSGTVPKHRSKYCDILYLCKPTKTKVHEIECHSKGIQTEIIPVECNVMSRKLSIKFLQPAIQFKDIPLNMQCVEKARMENSSREIALFYVMEPLIPGMTIQPMSGTIRPKMVITFDITVKISCVVEFNFDVLVKINNKEHVVLALSGNVVEPKLVTHPKYVYLPRVPCGMVCYVPVVFQNGGPVKSLVEVIDTDDENIFGVYAAQGNDKEKISEFFVEASQSKTVFVKVYDIFRREYDIYLPFKINRLIGPPVDNTYSTELRHYIGPFEEQYENNPKVKLKSLNKDITYFRVAGVITVPWLLFSTEEFEIVYEPNGENCVDFTITNISKYQLFVTIVTSKLSPNFSLVFLNFHDLHSTFNETQIKFDMQVNTVASFRAIFHPKAHGKFVGVALMYLDKACTLPYHNLTFTGKRLIPTLVANKRNIIFPPSPLKVEMSQTITLKMEGERTIDGFTCSSQPEPRINIKFVDITTEEENGLIYSIVTVLIKVNSTSKYSCHITLGFHHECGSICEVDVTFCYTFCPLTLHTLPYIRQEVNPYPFYPTSEQRVLYEYLEECTDFLEKWMFLQGFRRDLYPSIPDTFYAISSAMSAHAMKGKGMNVSFLNFFRRIAGPLTKHLHKISGQTVDESVRCVVEIHDTYKQIIHLLKCRGANLWMLQARFLLQHEHFVQYCSTFSARTSTDAEFVRDLLTNPELFYRLSKQCWIDFILQCYKVFVLDSCFFDCVCVSSQPRDIVNIIMAWYNEHTLIRHKSLRGNSKPVKNITNLTTDLSDGIAITSVFLSNCPFMASYFNNFCEIDPSHPEEGIISNACIILEVMTHLRIYFPLSSKDFLKPQFLQMLFLSIHLYVSLPMFKPRETIQFLPPLLKTSLRQITISPSSQESLSFNCIILFNSKGSFSVERALSSLEGNGKKNYFNVKYTARFVLKEQAVLLIHGYNKTRVFDTYVVFNLMGYVSSLNPVRKCKITCPMYRPNKTDILVGSPFPVTAVFDVYLTDIEPSIPVNIPNDTKKEFSVKRLHLIEKQITLYALVKENQDSFGSKLFLHMVCLSSQPGTHWIWFLSDVGQFFMKVTTQPRWDMALDTLTVKVKTWPMNPCSCGEACECYRTAIVSIPHRNELMLKSLRYALSERASDLMLNIYDALIESTTGQIVLSMLLFEGGTNMSEVLHILRKENSFRITSRNLIPRLDRATLQQHTNAVLTLPVTVPAEDKSDKFTVTLSSDCGMDMRTYRIVFMPDTPE